MTVKENSPAAAVYDGSRGPEASPGKSIRPEIDLGACNGCGGCAELAPEIFRHNEAFGFFEVVELDYYDPDTVWEAVKNCPKNAIRIDAVED